jgi:hypothetical protein
MSPRLPESIRSLEGSERLEQGVVEKGGLLDLRDVAGNSCSDTCGSSA